MITIEKNIISVNGNDFEYAVKGTKRPAIILINGAGGPIEGWAKIWGELGSENIVFAYNRLGMGKSSKPKEPQTGSVMVRDLKELLLSLNIEPPYLIVGHSLGGFIAQLFTLTYPEDVRGLVFLESSTIKDVLNDSKNKKEANPNKFSEVDHVISTVSKIQEAGELPNIPIYVIAGNKPAFGWLMPKAKKEARLNNQKELISLSGRGKVTIAEKSGHFPQISEPNLVINEINSLLKEITTE
ncbi:MAG: hydrolase, alpha/beta fold family [Bacillales bacterium]|jgi:pimeloyl-ACP methyl ester carboxylesterase|nr:hydrolase, alpha/beta fold family [Bacillales bacterium]